MSCLHGIAHADPERWDCGSQNPGHFGVYRAFQCLIRVFYGFGALVADICLRYHKKGVKLSVKW